MNKMKNATRKVLCTLMVMALMLPLFPISAAAMTEVYDDLAIEAGIQAAQASVPAVTLTLSRDEWSAASTASEVTVTVRANRVWTVSSDVSWLRVGFFSPMNRNGNGSFRIGTAANTTAEPRTGTITVTAVGAEPQTIVVTQAGIPGASLTLSRDEWSAASTGGEVTVTVESNRVWTVTSDVSWLRAGSFSPASRNGNGRFRIDAAANTSTEARTGTITVTAAGAEPQTIVVTQAGIPGASLTLSRDEWSATATGGEVTVTVESNRVWTVTSDVSWLRGGFFSPTNRNGNGSFRIGAAANTTTEPRTGTITVTAIGAEPQTIVVTQAGIPGASLTLSRDEWSAASTASNVTVTVESNRVWTVTSNVSWLRAGSFSPANRNGNGSFRIDAAANTSTEARTGTITVTVAGAEPQTIVVTQAGIPGASLTLSRDEWSATATGGEVTVTVESNRVWTVTSDVSWLRGGFFSPTNRNGNGSFRIGAAANTTTAERTGTITVTAAGAEPQTIVVTQAAGEAIPLAVSLSAWGVGAPGSSTTVQVRSDRTWTVSSEYEWLTTSLFVPSDQTGDGSFRITAAANTSTELRIGTITVEAPGAQPRVITVIQMGTAGPIGPIGPIGPAI